MSKFRPSRRTFSRFQLCRQEIQTHFELKEIILNSITAQFMADIASSIASKKWLYDLDCPPQWGPF